MKWQSIETAPKDGSTVLLYSSEHGILQGGYCSEEWELGPNGDEGEPGGWACGDGLIFFEDYDGESSGVTHWAPLPNLPKIKEKQNEG